MKMYELGKVGGGTRQRESFSVGHRFPRGLTMLPLMFHLRATFYYFS